MAKQQWFYADDRTGQSFGPMEAAALAALAASGVVGRGTRVSRDGVNWALAASVRGLFPDPPDADAPPAPRGPVLRPRPAPEPPKLPPPVEPWFYGFLEGWARVVFGLGIAAGALVFFGGLAAASDTRVGATGLLGLLAGPLVILAAALAAAPVLLAVDAARQLRALRAAGEARG
jgi:hypothetical protein